MNASLSTLADPVSIFRWLARRVARLQLAMIGGGEQQRAVGGFEPRQADAPGPGMSDPPPQIDPQELFAMTVRASADLDMDWMWLYARMTGSFERLYCLEKALARDPHNQAARDELRKLVGRR